MRRAFGRISLVTLIAVGAVAASAGIAGAQTCYPTCPSPSISTSTGSAGPGGTVTASGSGWPVGSQISFVLNSHTQVLDSFVTTNPDGSWTRSVTIPTDISGTHTLTVTGVTPDGVTRSAVVAVIAGGVTTGLAFTGSDSTSNLAIAGAVVLVIGIALVIAGRRRAKTHVSV